MWKAAREMERLAIVKIEKKVKEDIERILAIEAEIGLVGRQGIECSRSTSSSSSWSRDSIGMPFKRRKRSDTAAFLYFTVLHFAAAP